MNATETLGRMFNLEGTQQILRVGPPVFRAPWAHDAPAWLLFGCLAVVALALVFYGRFQPSKYRKTRTLLSVLRACVLVLLVLALAEPYLSITVATKLRPSLCLLLDGTDSMSIADDLPEAQRTQLAKAVGLADAERRPGVSANAPQERIEYVKALLAKKENNLLARLAKDFRLQAYLFDSDAGVKMLDLAPPHAAQIDGAYLAAKLTTSGQVTAIGAALEELSRRQSTSSLAGVVLISDFNENTGPAPLEAAKRLGAKIYAVGVGPAAAIDVAVDLQAPPVAKKDERATLTVTLRQQGCADQAVSVKLTARPVGSNDAPLALGEKSVRLSGDTQTVEFPYVPDKVGQFELAAEADPLPGEVIRENNRAVREVTVRDDFIRLLYVEYEPTWEWRFIKEVFHRDKLVGQRGFRTFLRSSDPKVRQTNELFLPSIAPPRSEFFTYDVILLGDMPTAAFTPRFCQQTEEFVEKFGGGMVVISGARFGPAQVAASPLGKMLPVIADPGARIRDREPFTLRLRPDAAQVDFMQLGPDAKENAKAWGALGPLPWYQPVERLHPMALALAEHPSDTCADGKTHQPLIALRRYGRGEVIYLAFNEMWRLRRLYGERYYRQFWGQMIHRLALSHALGAQKRFVVRTDRRNYRANDQVLLTVEAYDKDFQPLAEDAVPGGALQGTLVLPDSGMAAVQPTQPINVPPVRKGVFETRFPVAAPGEHRLKVRDPLADQEVEVTFQVAAASVERQDAVRNIALQQHLAGETHGKTYDLTTVDQLVDDIRLEPKREISERFITLWNTQFVFACVVGLVLLEWLLRKRIQLP